MCTLVFNSVGQSRLWTLQTNLCTFVFNEQHLQAKEHTQFLQKIEQRIEEKV